MECGNVQYFVITSTGAKRDVSYIRVCHSHASYHQSVILSSLSG